MKYFEPKNLLLISLFIITNILYSCEDEQTENIKFSEAIECLDSDPKKTLDILSSISETDLSEFQKNEFIILEIRALYKLGITTGSDSSIFQALDFFTKENDAFHAATASFMCARFSQEKNNPEEAIRYYKQAEKFAKKNNYDIYSINYSQIPYNLALLYASKGLYKKSLECAKEIESSFDSNNAISIYNLELIAISYTNTNILDSAELYYKKAFKISKELVEKQSQRRIMYNQAQLYYKMKNYTKSKNICFEILRTDKDIDEEGAGQIYLTLSETYHKTNKLDSAFICAYEAKKLLSGADNRIKISLYKILSEIEETRGNQIKSIEYEKIKNEFQIQVDNQKALISNAEKEPIQIGYYQKKHSHDSQLIKTKNTRIQIILIVTTLCLITIFILIYLLKKKNKNTQKEIDKQISIKVAEILEKDKIKKVKRISLFNDQSKIYLLDLESKNKELNKEYDILHQQKKEIHEFQVKFLKACYYEVAKVKLRESQLSDLKSEVEKDTNKWNYKRIKKIVNEINFYKGWEFVESTFKYFFHEISIIIKEDLPSLNALEVHICALHCAGIEPAEIAKLKGISTEECEKSLIEIYHKTNKLGYEAKSLFRSYHERMIYPQTQIN